MWKRIYRCIFWTELVCTAPCGLLGCKNITLSVLWPEVLKLWTLTLILFYTSLLYTIVVFIVLIQLLLLHEINHYYKSYKIRIKIVLLARAVFFCLPFVFLVYVVLCLIVFGCQYQCNWLPGKTCLWNDLLERLVSEMTCYVSSGTLKPTHSFTHLCVVNVDKCLCYAVVTCEIKLFQNYFAGSLQLMNIFHRVHTVLENH